MRVQLKVWFVHSEVVVELLFSIAIAGMAEGADSERPFDIVIYGATGYTGQLCVQQLDMLLSLPDAIPHSFAIAGRDANRLARMADKCSSTPVVLPVLGKEDISVMCSSARVVLACAGPYGQCGEDVVASCIEHGTHYIDVTFEVFFMHSMIQKYHSAAKEKGVMLIFSAGQESAPYEIMAYKLVQALGPIKEMTMYTFQYGFGSGGTAWSRHELIEQMTHKKGFEITNDPFSLGGLRRNGMRAKDLDCSAAEQDSLYPSLWLFPCTRTTNVRIIRRTSELFDETPSEGVRYGQDFFVRVRDAAPNQKAAEAGVKVSQGTPFLKFDEMAKECEDHLNLIKGQAPPQGLGNTPEVRALYYSDVYAVAESESGEWAYVYHEAPDTFEVTAISATAGVLTLLEELNHVKPEERGGCVTPAYAFHGTTWIERVEAHNFTQTKNRRCTFTLKQGTPELAEVKKTMNNRSAAAIKGQAALTTGKILLWGQPPLADKEWPEEEEEEEAIEEIEPMPKPLFQLFQPETRRKPEKPPARKWIVVSSQTQHGIPVKGDHPGGPLCGEKLGGYLPLDAELEEVEFAGHWLRFKNLGGTGPEAGWAETEKDGEALIAPKTDGLHSVDRPLSNPDYPRVLCLHGYCAEKRVLDLQLSRLFERGKGMVDFVVLEATKQVDELVAIEAMSKVFPGMRRQMYGKVFLDSRGWRCINKVRKILEELQDYLKQNGPFDAVLGFSQGANLAVMLAAQAAHGVGVNVPSIIAMSPQAPGYVGQVPELFSSALPNRALIVRGSEDLYNGVGQESMFVNKPYKDLGQKIMSDHVVGLFHKAYVYTHSSGHQPLPSDMKEKDEVVDRILDFIRRKPWKPQEIKPEEPVVSKPKSDPKPAKEAQAKEVTVEVKLAAGERKQLLKEFRKATKEQRSDYDSVLSIMQKCGIALEFAESSLQADRTIVAAAVGQDGFALEYAADELRDDFDIVKLAVQQDGWALEFASSKLQDNAEIVLEAVRQTWKALRFASTRVRRDEDIMAAALEQSPDAKQYAVE